MAIKLNIGCGTDYRNDFINIDGSSLLNKVDKVIDISTESLLEHYPPNSIDFILANDIIEHHFHWEAVRILSDFYKLLKPKAECEIRVPDTEYIIKNPNYTIEQKIVLMYGGQDIPQGNNHEMNNSRKQFPEYFCHKYGWTMNSLSNTMKTIGFNNIKTIRAESNFILKAIK